MLEASDDLGHALELADEVGMVRELGMDGLDRDLAPDLRLRGAIDDAERALADRLEQPVSMERLSLEPEVGYPAGILSYNVWSSVEGSTPSSSARISRSRWYAARASVCLPDRYRAMINRPEPFPQGMLSSEVLGLAENVDVMSAGDVGPEAILERLQMQVVEPAISPARDSSAARSAKAAPFQSPRASLSRLAARSD